MNEAIQEALRVPDAPISSLTDRELMEEIAESQRKILALVGGIVAAASRNPMMAAMLGGGR